MFFGRKWFLEIIGFSFFLIDSGFRCSGYVWVSDLGCWFRCGFRCFEAVRLFWCRREFIVFL